MIDLHCHLLPGVDDGPPTLEASLALARRAREDGIATIAATPHVDWEHLGNDAARIGAGVRALQPEIDAAGVDLRVVPGAEVAHLRALELDDAQLRALTLGGGPWLLLECPLSQAAAPGFVTAARVLAGRGHRLLLAHPERSPVFLRDPALLERLVEEGMLAQVTAGALTGRFGRTVRDLAVRLIERRAIHVVASDGHGESRPATIARELAEAGIAPALGDWMARDVPEALLAGDPIPARPRGRRRLARLRARLMS